jgi:hypothetical protein
MAAGHQLRAAIPGLRVDLAPTDDSHSAVSSLSLRVFIPALSVLRTDDVESASRSLLGQLARLQPGEEVRICLAVRPAEPRVPQVEPTNPVTRDHQRRLRRRLGEPSFSVSGLILARTGTVARARELLDGIGQVMRGRGAQGRPLRLTYDRSGRRLSAVPRTSRRAGTITAAELAGLVSWPVGDAPIAQVTLGASREMMASRSVGREGVRLFVGRDVTGERPICLEPAAQPLHAIVTGPTGSGKSSLITRVGLDGLAAGQAGIILEPKDGGLNRSFIERVPDEHRDRVIVIDPGDADAPVGIDLFAAGDADVRAEAITATLRAVFAPQGAWGVRSDHYVALAIRSLAVLDQPSLLLAGRLFTDPGFRQQVVSQLQDPVLRMAWGAFEELSPEARREHVAAPLNRLMSILQRPAVRSMVAQPQPKLRLGELWRERSWVLVNLSPAAAGESGARLLGAICGFLAWSTLEARAGEPQASRIPTNLVFDELQALSDLPVSLERLAERSRAFGGQLLLATQSASRLPGPLADAIFGNFATILTFKPGAAESTRLAREMPGLEACDLMALGPYEVAGRVATGTGTGVVTLTGRTEPLPPRTGNADYIRARSVALYGTPRAELDQAVREQLGGVLPDVTERPAPGRSRRVS